MRRSGLNNLMSKQTEGWVKYAAAQREQEKQILAKETEAIDFTYGTLDTLAKLQTSVSKFSRARAWSSFQLLR